MVLNLVQFLCYSVMAGWIEAVLYSRKAYDAFKWNEHALYVTIAGIVGTIYLVPAPPSIWDRLAVVICWALSHPFFHDGAYYEARRAIDQPQYWWFYNFSKTSEARMEIRLWLRCAMVLSAFAGLATYIYLS